MPQQQKQSTMPEYFAPLPKKFSSASPWKHDDYANLGLVFDKCGDAWTWTNKNNRVLEFNPPPTQEEQSHRNWLAEFENFANKPPNAERSIGLRSACDRQRSMINRLGGRVFYVRNESRFVTGMGRQHPLENGFSWHHTLGMPYLAGSGLKGMFRAWLRECGLDDEDTKMVGLFGGPKQVGELIFFDLLPLDPVSVVTEIMTPHYGDYYQKPREGKQRMAPGDWQSPNPISFLAVEVDQPWQFGLALRPRFDMSGKPLKSPQQRTRRLDDLLSETFNGEDCLLDGLQWLGVGAKTAIGMGRFVIDPEIAKRIEAEQENTRKKREAEDQRVREQAEFQASLACSSTELAELLTLQKNETWPKSPGHQKMTQGLLQFAQSHSNPPKDCLDWIRDWLESIPNYNGVWDDPEKKKGKNKDQDFYGSKTIREIVKLLNPNLKK